MDSGFSPKFRFLDSEADRQELAAEIHRVRQTVITLAEAVPPEKHYEPRYHGAAQAALLAHLNTMDAVALLAIKLALVGIHPPLPLKLLAGINDRMARLFQRRVVGTTIEGIQAKEAEIVSLVMTLPMNRFTREVYYPPSESYLTVEQALQQYFLFHWQEHLQTLQRGEGIYYEPPDSTALI